MKNRLERIAQMLTDDPDLMVERTRMPRFGFRERPPKRDQRPRRMHGRRRVAPGMVAFNEREVLTRIARHLKRGNSQVKDGLRSGELTMGRIASAIKQGRCIPGRDKDLGDTYLKNIIGNAIREVVPEEHVNAARRLFGLPGA